jgi:signal transduction histidine kinase
MITERVEGLFVDAPQLFERYRELQDYVGWTDDDARRVQSVADLLDSHLPALVDDFYAEIDRHPDARKVITGGAAQVQRLKGTLLQWLKELLAGRYDEAYVRRRWRVGWRHVEIGLDQVYTNVALSRLRKGLLLALEKSWTSEMAKMITIRSSLNTLIDLDLAIIEDAYQAEYLARQQRVERLAAIGQVAGGVAHELRNPLNVVKTSVYYLMNTKNANPEKIAEHLGRIEKHVGLADNVITALSNFAKFPVPNLRPTALGPLVAEAAELNLRSQHVNLTIDCPRSLPPVLVDADQLRIVIGNLIRNAREAMPNGGKLTLTGRPVGVAVELDVADTGCGIAPENLHRIMEPLFSTKARGLGLGLAIVRAVLEKNQGSLRVKSEVGKGTTFTLRLTAAAIDGESR